MSHHPGHDPEPCELLVHHADLLPASGCALDLACGMAGNAILLAEHGLQTTATDYDAEVIADAKARIRELGLNVDLRQEDATCHLEPAGYDVIVISRFLDRGLALAIERALKPGGLLYYQTFSIDVTSGHGPRNRNYLLRRNELLRLFPGLIILVYHEPLTPGQVGLVARRQA